MPDNHFMAIAVYPPTPAPTIHVTMELAPNDAKLLRRLLGGIEIEDVMSAGDMDEVDALALRRKVLNGFWESLNPVT